MNEVDKSCKDVPLKRLLEVGDVGYYGLAEDADEIVRRYTPDEESGDTIESFYRRHKVLTASIDRKIALLKKVTGMRVCVSHLTLTSDENGQNVLAHEVQSRKESLTSRRYELAVLEREYLRQQKVSHATKKCLTGDDKRARVASSTNQDTHEYGTYIQNQQVLQAPVRGSSQLL